MKIENCNAKIENCTILISKGKFILLPQEQRQGTWVLSLIWRTIKRNWHTSTVTYPSTHRGGCCLTQVYLAVDRNSMPITTDLHSVSSCSYIFLSDENYAWFLCVKNTIQKSSYKKKNDIWKLKFQWWKFEAKQSRTRAVLFK